MTNPFDEIKNQLVKFEAEAADRGFPNANADFHINWVGEGYRLRFILRNPRTEKQHEKSFGGVSAPLRIQNLNEYIHEAFIWLETIPTPDQTREQDFLESLAKLIDEGKDIGTPILADLEATMKRLSHNILENQS